MKQLIKESGKTIEQLAELLGVSHVTFHKYKKNPLSMTITTAEKLAVIFEVKPKDFIGLILKQK